MTFGERIRARREELGLTQIELAKLSGMVQPTLSQIETGSIEWPRGCRIVELADALQVTTDYLLREEVTDAKST